MTKREIIEETLEYYSKNNRGLNEHQDCVYLAENGDMCAVGRCLIDPTKIEDGSIGMLFDNSLELDKLLKEPYRGYSLDFWKDLQDFHDSPNYWEGNNLTLKGKQQYQELFSKYD